MSVFGYLFFAEVIFLKIQSRVAAISLLVMSWVILLFV